MWTMRTYRRWLLRPVAHCIGGALRRAPQLLLSALRITSIRGLVPRMEVMLESAL